MRLTAIALTAASSLSAATYTNSFGVSDPALVTNATYTADAYDTSVAPNPSPAHKPWDITPNNGSVTISGWATLSQAYIDTYGSSYASVGAMSYAADVSLPGLSPVTLSEISSISYQITANAANTAPVNFTLWLVGAGDVRYQVHPGNSTYALTRTGPGDTGDYIITYTNITLSNTGQNPDLTPFSPSQLYSSLRVMTGAAYDFANNRMAPNQFVDLTLQSISLTTVGGAPVPEPSTYGLMLGGLALAGAVIRRRAKK